MISSLIQQHDLPLLDPGTRTPDNPIAPRCSPRWAGET